MTNEDRSILIQYRVNKATDTLNEVPLLIANELWNTAVNRLYYACYYAVIALLIQNRIEATTHAGVRQMLGQHFVKNALLEIELGKFYSYLFNMRQTGDYEDFMDFTREDVEDLILPATSFIEAIKQLIN